MKVGARVKVIATVGGSDRRFAGRVGIVVEFDPSLQWTSPRALMMPEQFVCVHFLPVSKTEYRRGSPIDLIHPNNLRSAQEEPSR